MGAFWKKISAIACTVGIMFGVSSCEPAWKHLKNDLGDVEIVSVQLIKYDNSDTKTIHNTIFKEVDVTTPFDFEKMQVLEELPQEDIEGFINDLLEEDMYADPWVHSDSPNGTGFRIIAESGDFWVITVGLGLRDHYLGCFDAQGTLIQYLGEFDFDRVESLTETWFEGTFEDYLD